MVASFEACETSDYLLNEGGGFPDFDFILLAEISSTSISIVFLFENILIVLIAKRFILF